jgi:multidrug resistance protein, MATE family
MSSASVGISRKMVLQKAWPIMLANASVPLLGLSDTAVIGHFGSLEDLGAIAFGAIVFSFVYWTFGFLRMGTTGFVSQAVGAANQTVMLAATWRAVLLGIVIGLVLMLIQRPIAVSALSLLQGSQAVETITRDYIAVRIWGAPAALALFALMGCLIGLGHSKALLFIQLLMNGLNIVLDVYLAGLLGMGATGIALGTVIAEWVSVLVALVIVVKVLQRHTGLPLIRLIPWSAIKDMNALRHTLRINSDIMIRTLLMVASFAWFVRQSAQFGDDVLAANHILLQFISFSAFFLDAYAYVAEALVGEALGAGDSARFEQAVLFTSQLAGLTALVLGAIIWLTGDMLVQLLNSHPAVWQAASAGLPLAALYVMLAFAAFQLDGIFIGTSQTRAMRNAAIVSVACFVPASLLFSFWWHLAGLWAAFVLYVIMRALTLGYHLPELRRRFNNPVPARDQSA